MADDDKVIREGRVQGGPSDADLLADLDQEFQILDDYVAQVAQGYQTGLYVHGPGGTGKTWNVTRRLRALKARYVRSNSQMTGKGLFRAMQAAPKSVHLLEDMESLVNDRVAQNVLRAALWAPPGDERVVTWTTEGQLDEERRWRGPERFTFTGGLIMTGNVPFADMPVLRALASRILMHTLAPTDGQVFAQMRRIAGQGFKHGHHTLVSPTCVEVTDYLIGKCQEVGLSPDLRLQHKALTTYLYCELSAESRSSWQHLVDDQVAEAARHFDQEAGQLSRAENRETMLQVVREVWGQAQTPAARLALWRQRTGKKRAVMYRYAKMAGLV